MKKQKTNFVEDERQNIKEDTELVEYLKNGIPLIKRRNKSNVRDSKINKLLKATISYIQYEEGILKSRKIYLHETFNIIID